MTAQLNNRWDLSSIAPSSDEAFAASINSSVMGAIAFGEKYRGNVATLDHESLFKALVEFEKLQSNSLPHHCYAHLIFAEDSSLERPKRLSQMAAESGNLFSRELIFFDLELMAISEENFAAICASPTFANYTHFLTSLRKFRPHTLTEREEQLLKLKEMTGSEAFTRLYDEISASFIYTMEINGEEQQFSGEELLGNLHSPDSSLREKSLSTFLEKHGEQSIVFTSVFNNMALDHSKEIELRGYEHPMQPTNKGNELSDESVRNLICTTEANYPLAQDYFRIKAKLLGVEKLRNCDIYAPLSESPKNYSFDEATELVIKAYNSFSPDYGDILQSLLDSGRADVYPRPAKSGGAFCMGISPEISPYVLLNHTANLRDVATLAHELGHALHYVKAAKQTLINYHPPLPLAETASVFGEMLLTRMMLDNECNKEVKIALLCAKIEDIIATTFRQIMLTSFEERVHLERKTGLLSDDAISRIWLEENGKLFGNSVEMIDSYKWGWTYISHFIHTRFYCYSYTFAELLVLALYRQYQLKGAGFIPGYNAILESGGALSPADTAALAGIDINEPHFWQNGYDMLALLIEELKGLV